MKRKVYLEGEIADKFGKEFTMNVKSFGEVMRCLEANFKGFKKYLIDCHEKDVMFQCMVAGKPIEDERELFLLYPEGDMVITSVPAGSRKSQAGQMIMAAVMIYIGVQLGGIAGGAPSSTSTTSIAGVQMTAGQIEILSLMFISMGVNLGMSALSQMMAPDPSTDNDQDESYLFQGTGQTIIEGDPVPVLYGRLRVPGRPISFHAKNEFNAFTDYGGIVATSPEDTDSETPGYIPPAEDQGNRDEEYYPDIPIIPGL